jgi:UDP-N-acetylglucosamine--N-acetylmuramyl-(pentapeptide) pyrophosphoryl-undecaprenol N-acetylglucosamine transferase
MQVTLQTRSEDKETAEIALQAGGLSAEIATYFDDMPERMAASQLVIARAGASTLAELAAIGRPAILIPLSSSADNHQHKNAQVFADHHGAILAPESEATGERLARTMRALLEDPARLAAMAEAVKALAHPDASAAITQRLERLCHDG